MKNEIKNHHDRNRLSLPTPNEVKGQLDCSSRKQYVDPSSGFAAGDARDHLEGLHEMYTRFMREAVKEEFSVEYVDEVDYTYGELRLFLKNIIKQAEHFEELKSISNLQS